MTIKYEWKRVFFPGRILIMDSSTSMLPSSLFSQKKSLLDWQEIYSRQIMRSFLHKGSGTTMNIPATMTGVVPTVAILVNNSVEERIGQHLNEYSFCSFMWAVIMCTHAIGPSKSIILILNVNHTILLNILTLCVVPLLMTNIGKVKNRKIQLLF